MVIVHIYTCKFSYPGNTYLLQPLLYNWWVSDAVFTSLRGDINHVPNQYNVADNGVRSEVQLVSETHYNEAGSYSNQEWVHIASINISAVK